MRKRRKTPLYIALIAFMLCSLTFGVYSYMFKKTNTVSNHFLPGTVRCEVNEVYSDNVKSEVTVTNTGNVDAYIRVRLVTYWVNNTNVVVAKPSAALTITPINGWIDGGDNTYYYPYVIKPNGSTPDLLGNDIVLLTEDGYYQAIDVFAEAIQANPSNAVTESWDVTLGEDNTTIVSVK